MGQNEAKIQSNKWSANAGINMAEPEGVLRSGSKTSQDPEAEQVKKVYSTRT